MRKISRHHALHPESGVPMVEIDMISDNGERTILHQEGIASHPLSGKYTKDQIQIIEFINKLLFNAKQPNLSEREIEYMLYDPEAIRPRRQVVEQPKVEEISAQPDIFSDPVPLVTEKPQSPTNVMFTVPEREVEIPGNISADGSAYNPEPEEEVITEELVIEESQVEPEPEVTVEVTVEEPVITEITTLPVKKKRKTKVI